MVSPHAVRRALRTEGPIGICMPPPTWLAGGAWIGLVEDNPSAPPAPRQLIYVVIATAKQFAPAYFTTAMDSGPVELRPASGQVYYVFT